jgi:hypothetical protein
MKLCLAIISLAMLACGPSWSDVIRHPDGTIENPETGECWRDTSAGPVPVQCPRRTK